MAFFIINLGHVDINLILFILPFAILAFFVSNITTETKTRSFFQETKSGKNKM